jgi:phosphomannomutase
VRRGVDGSTEQLDLPASDMVGLELDDGGRVQARPSGTEPKLKFYLEIVEPVDGDMEVIRKRAAARLEAVGAAFLDAAGIDQRLREDG